jgi:subtilase family serine protease
MLAAMLAVSACTAPTGGETGTGRGPDACPSGSAGIGGVLGGATCMTPHALRVAYGVQPLTDKGYTGKGQTVMVVVSYTSPTLQQDLDTFSDQFGLPHTTLQFYKLQPNPDHPSNPDVAAWGGENTLDVEMIHAIAPDAHLVVLVSQVDETEGTAGLPQMLQIERYAVQHHLGTIFSQSFSASEATLADSAGQQVVQQFDAFYRQIATQGYTVLTASGDTGATDCATVACAMSGGGQNPQDLATTPTIGFPAGDPWVTTVGGTSLHVTGGAYAETAWACDGRDATTGCSGGGTSQFFAQPGFQRGLPASLQPVLDGRRGIPDVAANADPATGLDIYQNGRWQPVGGTSASTPLWAGVVAVANQMAGHPLGFITPGLYTLGRSSAYPRDFRDITEGNNSVATPRGNVQGFAAAPGYDLITGWGAPLADHLIPDLIAAMRA